METRVLIIALEIDRGLVENIRSILASTDGQHSQTSEALLQCSRSVPPSREILAAVENFQPNMVLLTTTQQSITGTKALVEYIVKEFPGLQVVLVCTDEGADGIMDLLSLGVVDYITAPVKAADLLPRLWRIEKRRPETEAITLHLKEKLGLERIVGKSPGLVNEVRKIPVVAKCDAAVLVMGETGTGKELCARAVHYLSPRSAHPFVAVNCGAIPPELVENELFGHVPGAFTGAQASQLGLIGEADEGTLFLDDIDSLPLLAQVKLLRCVQEKEYRKLGSTKTLRADVRVVAATNVDLEAAVGQGRFRRDLFYRLNVILLYLPPLRDRREDILLLAHHFLQKYSLEFEKNVAAFSPAAIESLLNHRWPGNVRELENVVERAVVFSNGRTIETVQVNPCGRTVAESTRGPSDESLREAKARMVSRFEKEYIEELLRVHRGNISQAARAARKNRRAFWELVRKYGVDTSTLKNEFSGNARIG
jgi:two-component system, NtrC family, response regulator GlrR